MGSLRAISCLACLAAGLLAQQQAPAAATETMRLFPCQGLARYEDAELPPGGVRVADRLTEMLKRVIDHDGRGGRMLQVANSARGPLLVVRSSADDVELVQRVVEQLQKETPPRVRLHVSIATMPAAVARVHSDKHGLAAVVDDEAVGRLLRDVGKHKGWLRNLPEVAVGPLEPFTAEAADKVQGKDGKPLRLRGEMLPVGEREVAVALHLVRGELPAARTKTPTGALLQPVFRLQPGRTGVAMVYGDTTTALVVRCVEVAAEAPPPAAPAPPKR